MRGRAMYFHLFGTGPTIAIRDTGTGIALEDQPRILKGGLQDTMGMDKRSRDRTYLSGRILNRLSMVQWNPNGRDHNEISLQAQLSR